MKIVEMRKNKRKRVYTINKQASKTDQSFKEDCDVNLIVQRWLKTGQISHLAKNQGVYADATLIPDLQDAMSTVAVATQAFDNLPAKVRERFGNSPVALMNFLSVKENYDEGVKLGFFKPRPQSETPPAPPAAPPKETKKSAKQTALSDDSNDA